MQIDQDGWLRAPRPARSQFPYFHSLDPERSPNSSRKRPLPAVVSGFAATWPVTPIDIFRVPIVARSIAPGRTAPARW